LSLQSREKKESHPWPEITGFAGVKSGTYRASTAATTWRNTLIHFEKSREAIKRYGHEMARVMSTPEIADLYMREIVGSASEPSNRP